MASIQKPTDPVLLKKLDDAVWGTVNFFFCRDVKGFRQQGPDGKAPHEVASILYKRLEDRMLDLQPIDVSSGNLGVIFDLTPFNVSDDPEVQKEMERIVKKVKTARNALGLAYIR